MPPLIVAVIVALLILAGATIRQNRRNLLRRIRSQWGSPSPRLRNLTAIRESHESRLAATSVESLDDRTWHDLDLDAVFAAVDRTESTLGQHALYHRLRSSPVGQQLDAFEGLVTRFTADVSARERAQVALAPLQDPQGYNLWWLGRPDALDLLRWHAVFPLLAMGTLVALALTVWFHVLPLVLASLGVNVVVRHATDHRVRTAATAFRQLAPLIASAQGLAFLAGADIDPLVGSIRREAPRLAPLKALARWLSGNPFMLSVDATWVALVTSDFVGAVYEYLNLAFLLDANALFFGARMLRNRAPDLLETVEAIGEVDAALAVASFRTGTAGWTRPRFCHADEPVSFLDLRHPLVCDAVPSSIRLAPPYGVLVTGSNMSGKSTFLRTIGVSTVLAQTIHTCLAAEYVAPILKVRSCIARADDLQAGKSYYLVEVEALLGLVRASVEESQHLFLLDELFRGTNAVERIAAGDAVLRELMANRQMANPHFVVAATHDGELVDLLDGHYAVWHLGDAVGPDGLVFDYQLRPGPATTRNAIALLRQRGAPEALVDRALALVTKLDQKRKTLN